MDAKEQELELRRKKSFEQLKSILKPMSKAKQIRCAIFSVLCTIIAILFIPSVILGIWWDIYPFWKVTATQVVLIFTFNFFSE